MKLGLALLLLLNLHWAHSAQQVFDVTKHGAKADGKFLNTKAIADAIAEAHANPGGGIVHFPKGESFYLTGPIHLKSHVTLQVDKDVLIKFTDDFEQYLPMVEVRWEGIVLKAFSPLIYAYNQTDIGVKGEGTLDGQGEKWWNYWHQVGRERHALGHYNITSKWQQESYKVNADIHEHLKTFFPKTQSYDRVLGYFHRPAFFQPMYSSHITLEGVTLLNSPFWTVQPTFSEYITIDKVTVINPKDTPNTDGIDPDSCRHVTVSNCDLSTGDDCIAIKSGRDKEGRDYGIPSENITVTDTVMRYGYSAFLIGSEQSGGAKNIYARNLRMENTTWGFHFRINRDRGAILEDIVYEDIHMHAIHHEAILVNPWFDAPHEPKEHRDVSAATPIIRNVVFRGITGDANGGIGLEGLPEMHLQNIELADINLKCGFKMQLIEADGIKMNNVTLTVGPLN